jgi:hypothetical protein
MEFVEETGQASFGNYRPGSNQIQVALGGRHIADVLRTLAHEIVHHKQMENNSEMDLIGLELEANAVAGMILRDWNKAHPELYGVTHSDNASGDEGESMGATFADPTRPTGPVGLAELSTKTLACYKKQAGREIKQAKKEWYSYKNDNNRRPAQPFPDNKRTKGIERAATTLKKRYAVQEDAPVNAAGSGEIAGIGVGPQGEPGIKKSNMVRRKPKSDLAKIFTGFAKPKKLFKEYKATIQPKKNLGFLGLGSKTLRQMLRGHAPLRKSLLDPKSKVVLDQSLQANIKSK